jgi:serine/threonine-protein kinase
MRDALDWAAQVCDGLDIAHQQGVIHRDVKPENCFLTIEGVVKLMDFGIARVQAAPGITVTSTIFGTPAYISPEQVSDYRGVTAQSDLYSLGVMLFEFLVRRLPFVSPDLFTLLRMHSEAPPPTLRSIDPRVPPSVEALVLRLLSKKAADRPASAHETRRLLLELKDSLR